MTEPTADESTLKTEVQRQLDEAKEFAKTLSPEEARSGDWFLKLLSQVTKAYDRNARATYFQKKYPGLPADDIADTLVSVATRYAAITGAVTGAAATVGVVSALPSGGATLAVFLGSLGAEMLTLSAIQMRLVLDMSVVYDLQLDPEDPEDVLMIFGYAVGIKPADVVGAGVSRAAGVVTKSSIKKHLSKQTLQGVQKFGQRIGVKILQRTVIKYAVPLVSAAAGSGFNYVTTKSLGEIAKRHMKNRGKVTDELRAAVSKSRAYELAVPAAAMFMARSDGCVDAKEKELYKAMLSRMSFDDHSPDDFDRLVRDKDSILDAISKIEDHDMLEALVEIVTLMAIYDGAIVPEEHEWLLCVAEAAHVPIDLTEVERRAREYETVIKETLAGKAQDLAGDAAGVAKDKLRNVFGRSERWRTQE
ncbi:MAG: hypothetical protein GXY46_10700 [Actinobacteria bacterium]|nr:hypothetical protein [Actinomycetota bacterium]